MTARTFARRYPVRLIGLAAALVLGTALVIQHGFGYLPCALCYRQRWPYYLWIGLGLVALIRPSLPALLLVAAATGLGSAGLGLHHLGVERDWWAGPAACAGGLSGDLDKILDDVMAAPIVPCDEPTWTFLSLSMADYNFLISLGLTGFALWARTARRA